MNDFPPPPNADTAMYHDMARFDPEIRRAFVRHAIDLQEGFKPGMSTTEMDDLEARFKANLAQDTPEGVVGAMGLDD